MIRKNHLPTSDEHQKENKKALKRVITSTYIGNPPSVTRNLAEAGRAEKTDAQVQDTAFPILPSIDDLTDNLETVIAGATATINVALDNAASQFHRLKLDDNAGALTDFIINLTGLAKNKAMEFIADIQTIFTDTRTITWQLNGTPVTMNGLPSAFGDPGTKEFKLDISAIDTPVITSFDVINGAGSGGTDPIILTENNLGNVGPASINIDWSISNFYRMVLTGGVGITHINLPPTGKWEQLIIEFIQDITGGHAVTFTQGYANGVVPIVNLAATTRTTVVFYAYKEAVSIILAFETGGNKNYIHATKTANQAAPLTVGTPATFDTSLGNNVLTVDAAGRVSGFRAGHIYECECAMAIENSVTPGADTSFQWYDVANAVLIGSRGDALLVDGTGDSAQMMAKAIFVPAADSDTLEVHFTLTSDLTNSIMYGIGAAGDPQSYIMIKDIT